MKNVINILMRESQELKKELKNSTRVNREKDAEIGKLKSKIKVMAAKIERDRVKVGKDTGASEDYSDEEDAKKVQGVSGVKTMLLQRFMPKIQGIILQQNTKKLKSIEAFPEITFANVHLREISSILEDHVSFHQKKGIADLLEVGAETFIDATLQM